MAQFEFDISTEDDIYLALSSARQLMNKLSFLEMNCQKVLVSISELTRNVLDHAYGKGFIKIEMLSHGICITVSDKGPGIPDIDSILSGKKKVNSQGLGLGLSGVKRLMDEVYVETNKGGTKIIAVKWKDSR